jgi:hypothetical protein
MVAMPGASRDPVSVRFDGPARRLLDRAYAQPGTWVQVWLPDPDIRARTWAAGLGLPDLTGPDPLPSGAGLDARTRWGRGFVRALYYQHKWFSPQRGQTGWGTRRTVGRSNPLRVEVGRHVAASPQFNPARPGDGGLPPRRRVRVQLAAAGRARDAAVNRTATKDRAFVGPRGAREPGPRWGGARRYADWA